MILQLLLRSALFILFLLAFSFGLSAQSVELSEVRKQKHHIELDVKNVFDGLGSATILYKKKRNPGKLIDVNALKLIRYSLSFRGAVNLEEDPNRNAMDTTASFEPNTENVFVSASMGLERQIYRKGIVISYGFELLGSYSSGLYGFGWRSTLSEPDVIVWEARREIIQIGPRTFIGFKYYFTPQFSVGIETGVGVAFRTILYKETFAEDVVIEGQSYSKLTEEKTFRRNSLVFFNENLRFLTIGYNF